MLIFDGFPSRGEAEQFAGTLSGRFGLAAVVCDSQAESNAIDPFPFRLDPPIVLSRRPAGDVDPGCEPDLVALAESHGGKFAGT
jgi:hypothetical protein